MPSLPRTLGITAGAEAATGLSFESNPYAGFSYQPPAAAGERSGC